MNNNSENNIQSHSFYKARDALRHKKPTTAIKHIFNIKSPKELQSLKHAFAKEYPLISDTILTRLFEISYLCESQLSDNFHKIMSIDFIHTYLKQAECANSLRTRTIDLLKRADDIPSDSIQNEIKTAVIHLSNTELEKYSLQQQVMLFKDMSERDTDTNLYNKITFEGALHQIITNLSKENSRDTETILIYLDGDNFSEINNNYGHPAGDEAIKAIASKLREIIRENDSIIGRIGGDEFAVILETSDPEKTLKRLQKELSQITFHWEGLDISMSVSLGMARLQDAEISPHDYQRMADTALYQHKRTKTEQEKQPKAIPSSGSSTTITPIKQQAILANG